MLEIHAGEDLHREECPPADAVRMLADERTRSEAFDRLAAWHATIPPLDLAPDGWCRSEWETADAALLISVHRLELDEREERLVGWLFDHVEGHGWSRSIHELLEAAEASGREDEEDRRIRYLVERFDNAFFVLGAYAREALARVKLRQWSRWTAKQRFAEVSDFLLGEGRVGYEGFAPFDGRLAIRCVLRRER